MQNAEGSSASITDFSRLNTSSGTLGETGYSDSDGIEKLCNFLRVAGGVEFHRIIVNNTTEKERQVLNHVQHNVLDLDG